MGSGIPIGQASVRERYLIAAQVETCEIAAGACMAGGGLPPITMLFARQNEHGAPFPGSPPPIRHATIKLREGDDEHRYVRHVRAAVVACNPDATLLLAATSMVESERDIARIVEEQRVTGYAKIRPDGFLRVMIDRHGASAARFAERKVDAGVVYVLQQEGKINPALVPLAVPPRPPTFAPDPDLLDAAHEVLASYGPLVWRDL